MCKKKHYFAARFILANLDSQYNKISNKNDFASFVLFVLYMNASDCEHFCLWEFPKTQFILRSDLRFQSQLPADGQMKSQTMVLFELSDKYHDAKPYWTLIVQNRILFVISRIYFCKS